MAKRVLDTPATALALYLLLVAGLTLPLAQAQQAHPLTKDRVIHLLKSYVLPDRVADLARHYGIDFEVTPAVEREIRAAGGDQALIEVLRGLAPPPQPSLAAPPRAASSPALPAASPPLAPGTVRVNPNDGQKYVWIPPGTFQMGCSPGDNGCFNEEKPAHQVTITTGFWLGQTEVTVDAYKRFSSATGRAMPPEPTLGNNALNPGWRNGQMPIVNVTWDDSQAYCQWAGGRLPSEAEWEYAARAGSTETRYGPLDEVAWHSGNSGNTMHAVGLKQPNGWRLYDMLGNVWEWVTDWYGANYYQASSERDPKGPDSGQLRVLRGGSWDSFPGVVRVSDRVWGNPGDRDVDDGCRCLREASIP